MAYGLGDVAGCCLIGVPTGIWLTRHPRWAKPVLGVVNIIQTIPSLALFGFLLPVPWLGDRAARIAIAALTAYALLPIVRNTYAGIEGVDPTVLEVAKALGHDQWTAITQSRASTGRGFYFGRFAHRDGVGGGDRDHRGGSGRRRVGENLSFAGSRRWITGWCWRGRFRQHCWRLPRMPAWVGWSAGSRCRGALEVRVAHSGLLLGHCGVLLLRGLTIL